MTDGRGGAYIPYLSTGLCQHAIFVWGPYSTGGSNAEHRSAGLAVMVMIAQLAALVNSSNELVRRFGCYRGCAEGRFDDKELEIERGLRGDSFAFSTRGTVPISTRRRANGETLSKARVGCNGIGASGGGSDTTVRTI